MCVFKSHNNNIISYVPLIGLMALMKTSLIFLLSLMCFLRLSPLSYGKCDDNLVGYDENPSVLLMRKAGGHGSLSRSSPTPQAKVIDVKNYGAKGDGSDATQAFAQAWNDACSSTTPSIFLVSGGGRYLLKPITFSGPCKSSLTARIQGTLLASSKISDWNGKNRKQWIEFDGVDNLHVDGGGTVDGNGEIWWKNSCKVDGSQPCTDAPTAMTFNSCNKLQVENLIFKNSQKMHVSFAQSNDVSISDLTISAPGTSPNTDGIHVTGSKNIHIDHCDIATGDDCISIVSGSQDVTVTNINCGPGHGISIGSLGKGNTEAYVSNVLVDTATLHGTTNGARIKTWRGGHGNAKNITFRNIIMNNVKNPIIIDQNYCDSSKPCKEQSSAVAVSDVKYKNIRGTSATDVSVTFDCSKVIPCQGIVVEDINLGASTKSFCNNVKLSKSGTVIPTPCAQSIKSDYKDLAISTY